MTQQRTDIVDELRRLLDTLYGPSGTTEELFREVRRGPLRRVDMWPTLTVCDAGQRRLSPWGDEQMELELDVLLWLHLAETWDRIADQQTWTDHVANLIVLLQNQLPDATGGLNMLYVDDEPTLAVWADGASEAVWEIRFAYRYFTEVNVRQDNS